jgi:hypothetical protein
MAGLRKLDPHNQKLQRVVSSRTACLGPYMATCIPGLEVASVKNLRNQLPLLWKVHDE